MQQFIKINIQKSLEIINANNNRFGDVKVELTPLTKPKGDIEVKKKCTKHM